MTGAVSAGIVGCGNIAGGFNQADESQILTHAVAYRRCGVPIAFCADIDEDRAAAFARRWNIPHHGTDVPGLVARTGAQVISDCVPSRQRRAVLEQLLSLPEPEVILTEKPLGLDGGEATALRDRIAGSGKHVLVDYFRAFDPFFQEVARRVSDGWLGRMQWAVASVFGGTATNMSHLLERLIAMFGEAVSVQVLGATPGHGPHDPGFAFALEHRDGTRSVCLPLDRTAHATIALDLIGTTGRLTIDDDAQRATYMRTAPMEDAELGDLFAGLEVLHPAEAGGLGRPDWQAIGRFVADGMALVGTPAALHGVVERAVGVASIIDAVRRQQASLGEERIRDVGI